MLRSEKIINIVGGLQNRDWQVVHNGPQGDDAHLFVIQLPQGMNIFPEKPNDDWSEVTRDIGVTSISFSPDGEAGI